MTNLNQAKVTLTDTTKYTKLATDDIFKLMGFSNLSEDKKKELTTKMMETINARVINRLSKMLGEKKMKQFLECMEKDDKADAEKLLQNEAIEMDKLIVEEVLAYKLEMTKSAQAIKNIMIKKTNND
jgi:hypothetical protein